LADINPAKKRDAKAVAPRKTIIFALQKSNKQLSLLVAFRQPRKGVIQIKPLLSAKTNRLDIKNKPL
jgi:hypothetical protein